MEKELYLEVNQWPDMAPEYKIRKINELWSKVGGDEYKKYYRITGLEEVELVTEVKKKD